MDTLRKVKRRFSIKHKDHEADYSADEADDETQTYLQKEIEDAEKSGHDTGKKGSFLNKLIEHGNRKTEEQIKRESMLGEQKVGSVDYAGAEGKGDGVVR